MAADSPVWRGYHQRKPSGVMTMAWLAGVAAILMVAMASHVSLAFLAS